MRCAFLPLIFILQFSLAQQIPQNPNQLVNGQRNGKWTLLFDKDWKEVNVASNASYYRTIEYQNGKPSGTARDYFKDGRLQWQGQLLSENPDVNDGVCIWYDDKGNKERESTYAGGKRNGKEITYVNGKKYSEGTYTNDTLNDDWIFYGNDYNSYLLIAQQAYRKQDYATAENNFNKAASFISKDTRTPASQSLKWWMYFVYDAMGKANEASSAITEAVRISNYVKDEYEENILKDAETLGDKLTRSKWYDQALAIYQMAARKRERLNWMQWPGYYYDLKGIVYVSKAKGKTDSLHYYFDRIAQIIPPTEPLLAPHLREWAIYTIERKQYDKLDVIEKYCETYLKGKEQKNEKDAGYAEAWLAYGLIAEAKGQNERALKSFADGRAAIKPEANQQLYVRLLSASATVYNRSKKFDGKASSLFTEFEQLNERFASAIGNEYYDNRFEVIRYFINTNNHAQAEQSILKTIPSVTQQYGKDSEEAKGLQLVLMSVYEKQGRTKEAADIAKQAGVSEKELINMMGLGNTDGDLRELSEALDAGHFVRAVNVFEKNLDLVRNYFLSKGDYNGYVSMNNAMAVCYQQVGNFYRAGELLMQSKKIADEKMKKTEPDYIYMLMSLGDFYKSTGLFKEADDTYYSGMKILDESKTAANAKENDEHYYNLAMKLADVMVYEGYYSDAQKLYTDAIDFKRERYGEKSLAFAQASISLADLYQRTKYFALSASIYEEMMPIIKKEAGEQSPLYIDNLRTLANIQLLMGNYVEAEEPYLKAKAFYQERLGVKSDWYIGLLADLGMLYTYSKQWSKADATYNEQVNYLMNRVKNVFPSMNEKEKTAFYSLAQSQFNTYNVFAIQQLKNNPSETSEMYNHQLVSKSLLFKATDHVRRTVMNSKDDSLKSMYSRWQTSKEQLAKIYQLSQQEKKANNINEQLIERKVNDLEKELTKKSQLFANMITDVPDWKAVRNKLKPGEAAIEIVRVREALPEFTFYYIGKGITYDTLDKEGYARVNDLPDRSAATKAGLRVGETVLEINGITTKGKSSAQLEKMNEASQAKLLIKKKNSKVTYTVQLSNDSVFYRTYPKKIRYVALIVTPQTTVQPDYVLLPNGDDLETKYVKFYKNAIRQQLEDNYSYKYFWQPIQKSLTGIRKVYFSPDGVYNSINPNTLYNPDTKRFLLDDIELVQVSNTADILNPLSPSPSRKAFLVGFPDYNQLMNKSNVKAEEGGKDFMLLKKDSSQRFFSGDRVSELPGTKTEVNTIEALLNSGKMETAKYILGDASEEKIKSIQSPKLLHIATHGFFLDEIPTNQEGRGVTGVSNSRLLENPLLRSGLLLAGAGKTISEGHNNVQSEDGILTAYEAMNLNLNQTELVVLSACETGLGKVQTGEGVYGLQRAFRAAGAQSVLMSLWKVDDQATQQLMTGFYSQWMKQGEKLNSFRAAQLKLREQFPHPYYWGAFVMIGQ